MFNDADELINPVEHFNPSQPSVSQQPSAPQNSGGMDAAEMQRLM